MGRSANSFAFLLVFVLLALVIYFIYQAATGASSAAPIDQASMTSTTAKDGKVNPDNFVKSLPPAPIDPTPPPVAETKKETAVAPVEAEKTPGAEAEKKDDLATKKSDVLPPPPPLPDKPPADTVPTVSKQEELLALEKDYTTQVGDTPWLLAVLLLGDGTRWKDIVDANPVLSEGARPAEKETALPAGMRIKKPKDAAPKEPVPAPPAPPQGGAPAEHKILAGDTLSAIMQRYYGETSMAVQKEILAENPDLDPDLLKVDTKIKLPVIPGKGPKSGT
jgi:nucleoid-associated protein YgaU